MKMEVLGAMLVFLAAHECCAAGIAGPAAAAEDRAVAYALVVTSMVMDGGPGCVTHPAGVQGSVQY